MATPEITQEEDILVLRLRVKYLAEPESLAEALDAMIAATADLKALLESGEDTPSGFTFMFRDDSGTEWDEEEFFRRTAAYNELDEKTLRYVENINVYNASDDYLEGVDTVWHDEERQAGSFAMQSLAMKNPAYVRQYADFLRHNDMGHEVEQFDFINTLLEKHGWREETLYLAAVRFSQAAGQQGYQQYKVMRERFRLMEYLEEQNLYPHFAAGLLMPEITANYERGNYLKGLTPDEQKQKLGEVMPQKIDDWFGEGSSADARENRLREYLYDALERHLATR